MGFRIITADCSVLQNGQFGMLKKQLQDLMELQH
uniref:Uncharacterized protein n=1 Tax=Dulem virus 42 TaxID=3145760 RepID=A0AAU8B7F7_9CAUD